MTEVVFPDSVWAVDAPSRTLAPALGDDTEADTAVIGAGLTGLSAALELARAGQRVVLLEAQGVGWGAAGRNNGQVIPTLSAVEPAALVDRFGAVGERFVNLVGNSAATLFDIARREGIVADAEAEQTGWFQPCHTPGRAALSRARAEGWRRFGFEARLLDRAEATALIGSDFWYGGMLMPSGGHVNPLGLARGLARAAEAQGATIHEATPVAGWRRDGARWIVTAQNGRTVRARHMILATHAYTGELVPGLASRLARTIIPMLTWQMATKPIPDDLRRTILPGRQAVSDTRGDLRFFRYDARNRLITGSAVLGSRDAVRRVTDHAARNLAEAFPALGIQQMTHVWSGHTAMTWDRFPRVHNLGPDAWTWIGCNGRGVALAVAMGREMARAVSGAAIGTLALPVVPQPNPIPFHAIGRRVAPYYLTLLRRKDRKELA